jgi:GcrA cell cycle regulator
MGEVAPAADPNWWSRGDRLAELKRRFDAGEPYSSIAAAMGTTKNAAISAAHRHDIGIRRAPPPNKPAPPDAFADLKPGACIWPIGDPRHSGFHFCGGRAIEGRPYCGSHMANAYIVPRASSGWTDERRAVASEAARRRFAGKT